MKDTKITIVRLRHCNHYIAKSPQFSEVIANGGSRNYEHKDTLVAFPEPVWKVALAIIDNGLEPCQLRSKDLIKWAEYILLGGPAPTAHAKVDPTPKAAQTIAPSAEAEAPAPALSPKGTGLEQMPVRLSIATLLYSAVEVASRFDKHANAEKDLKDLEEIAQRYQPQSN